MSYPLRLCLLVLISLGPSADSAKPFCKICKEFVESFNKVSLSQWNLGKGAERSSFRQ